jgi:type I restriction enzyme S subunit
VNNHIPMTRLGDAITLVMGQAPSSKDCNFEGRGTPFVKVGEFGVSRPVIREWTTNPLRFARTTDVLLCVVGATCGKINLGEECAIGRSVAAIRPDPKKLDQFYLYFFLMTLVESLRAGSVGAAQTVISKDMIQSVQLPLPPLVEQQRIVGVLDEAFEGVATAKAHAEKNLQNARALFDSHLNAAFTQRREGWVEKTLEELGTITSSTRIFKKEYVKSGVPFYRTKEIKELANGREISTKLFLSDARYNEIKKSFGVPKRGDILLTAIGTIGEIYVVGGDHDFYFKDGNVLWLKGFSTVDPHFLKYALVSFVDSLNKMAHGSAYSALPIQRLNAHKIIVPSLWEQSAIASQLDSLSEETQSLARLYEQKLAALEALKKSLLHQAFNGELGARAA